MDTIYRERANGRWEYWTYREGQRVYLSADTAERWIRNKTARLVFVG
jgi:hypothetical protein